MHTEFWWGNLRERGHLEDLRIERRILEFIFKKWFLGRHGLDLAQDRDVVAGDFECGIEPSGSIKSGETLVQLNTC